MHTHASTNGHCLWASNGLTEYLDRSLVDYAAASYHFEQAEHKCHLANVENNLGFLLYKVNHCDEAHQHLDSARRIFKNLKDQSSVAQVDETRARVFLKEKRLGLTYQALNYMLETRHKDLLKKRTPARRRTRKQ